MAKRIQNNLLSDTLTGRTGIDVLKDLSDNRTIGKIDYVALQVNQPSLVFKEFITDEEKLAIYDRHETFDSALWSEGDVRLTAVFTSSLQSDETQIYYKNIYKSEDESLGPEFSISYGDYYGYGSTTGSFGDIPTNVYESKAIYSKYQNMLLGSDTELFKFNFPSWSKSFNGLARPYSAGKSINVNLTTYTKESYRSFISNFPLADWKSVSSGYTFTTALREDGTLWAWGSNGEGTLGDGTGNDSRIPVQIGTDSNWVFHTSGASHSFAIKRNGTLWVWGKGSEYRLGTNSTSNVLSPVQITLPFLKTWKHAAAGNGHSLAIDTDGKLWAWGYNTSGQLGLGNTTSPVGVPQQVGTDTNWSKVYTNTHPSGDCFTLVLKENGELYGMGFNENYELGLNDDSSPVVTPTRIGTETYTVVSPTGFGGFGIKSDGSLWKWGYFLGDTELEPVIFQQAGYGWTDVKSSIHSVIGMKSNGSVYTWGDNEFGNLGLGEDSNLTQDTPLFCKIDPLLEEDKIGNRNIISVTTSDYADAGSNNLDIDKQGSFSTILSKYNIDEKYYEESDYIYVININRDRYKDSVKPGTWQLSLIGVDSHNMPLTGSFPTTLIDDSILSNIGVDNRDVYNVYSGSLQDGLYTGSFSVPYGLFYPNQGIIVLNGRSLYSFNSVFTNRSRPYEITPFEKSSNAETLYTSISASMTFDSSSYYFQGASTERIEASYIFVRIKSDEFNYTNNPTYVTGSNGFIHPKYRNNDFGLTYITTIGLYDKDENLVAVAKLSKPIKKTIEREMVIKIRIRY